MVRKKCSVKIKDVVCGKDHFEKNHKCSNCGNKGHDIPNCGIIKEKCSLCSENHKTEEHICKMCGFPGESSHKTQDCPSLCALCKEKHHFEEHRCSICSEKHFGCEEPEYLKCIFKILYVQKKKIEELEKLLKK